MTKSEYNNIKKTITILKKEFNRCGSYEMGCLSCDAWVAIDILNDVLETYKT